VATWFFSHKDDFQAGAWEADKYLSGGTGVSPVRRRLKPAATKNHRLNPNRLTWLFCKGIS
jgi:hypothetical protein